MRVPGYCERCHKIKPVRVSGHALVKAQARRGVVTGVCSACERKEDEERERRWAESHGFDTSNVRRRR